MLNVTKYGAIFIAAIYFSNPVLGAKQTKNEIKSPLNHLRAPQSRSVTNRALSVGSGVRLAIFCESGSDGECFGKNIQSISVPDTGITCVKPSSAAKLGDLTKIIPVVSVEWGTSSADVSNALFAYYRQSASDCPSGNIEVRTYDGNYGDAVLSDGIAFTLIVP